MRPGPDADGLYLDQILIWDVATTALDELYAACRAELDQIDQ